MSFKRYRDLILGVVMLLLSGFYLYFATQIKTRPKLTPAYASAQVVPILLGILLAVLAVLCIIQGIRRAKQLEGHVAEKVDKDGLITVTLTFAVIIGYIFVMRPAGFILSTVAYLFLQMVILAPRDKRNYLLFAIVAVVFAVGVYFIFRAGLQQLLPRGFFEDLLGF